MTITENANVLFNHNSLGCGFHC